MAVEMFQFSEPEQKRATRKLLIAGIVCVFLAVVCLAVVIAVILRQNEEDRIPHSSFDKQESHVHTASLPLLSSSSEVYQTSSIRTISSSKSDVYNSSIGTIASSKAEAFSSSSLLSSHEFVSLKTNNFDAQQTKNNLGSNLYSNLYSDISTSEISVDSQTDTIYTEILATYSTTDFLPVSSTSSDSYLSLYYEKNESYMKSVSTSDVLRESQIISTALTTDDILVPFSTSNSEDLQSSSKFYHIHSSFISKEALTEFSLPKISQILFTGSITMTKDSQNSEFSTFSDEMISSETNYLIIASKTHINLPQSKHSNDTDSDYSSEYFVRASILSTNNSVTMESQNITSTSIDTEDSVDMILTTSSTHNDYFTQISSYWLSLFATSKSYSDTSSTVYFTNSEFSTSSLNAHPTFAVQTDSFMDVTTFNGNNFNPTTWTTSTEHVTVSSTLFPACSDTEFRCSSGQCVNIGGRCDRVAQCEDITDEFNCTNCVGYQCGNGLCLWSWNVQCDKHVDCIDLSDEIGCNFGSSYKRCDNGMSVPSHKWCDNVDDCFDNSDEANCTCSFLEIPCKDGRCIRQEWICDGHIDCVHGTDETNCSSCTADQFVCSDYSCIDSTDICDGVTDCHGNEDEANCYYMNPTNTALKIQIKGDNYTACSSHWNSDISDSICQILGYKNSNMTKYLTEDGITGDYFVELDQSITDYRSILQHMKIKSTCTSNQTVSVTCMPRECGKQSPNLMLPFVSGGDIAALGQWPWIVSLSYLGRPFCSGTLISEEWVVTAGHCVARPGHLNYTVNPHYTEVLLGSVKRLRSHGITRRADKIIHHPRLKWTLIGSIYYDLALIHLDKPVVFDDYIVPICFPELHMYQTTNCYIAGWGYIGPNQDVTVEDLREGKLHILTDEECQNNIAGLEQAVNTNITHCAGYRFGVISGCQGDSGSPMMCQDYTGKWTLAGVMSSGPATCGTFTTRASRFTKISAMMDWIDKITGGEIES